MQVYDCEATMIRVTYTRLLTNSYTCDKLSFMRVVAFEVIGNGNTALIHDNLRIASQARN